MSLEAGVLVDLDGQPLFWHVPKNRSVGSLPDSRSLWDMIWHNRDRIMGFAHSHPGGGVPSPSFTDITTFRAIEQALGTHLVWWIVSSEAVVICRWHRRSRKEPGTWVPERIEENPTTDAWLSELRRLSYGGE